MKAGDRVVYMGDASKKGTGTIVAVDGSVVYVKFDGWRWSAPFKAADLTVVPK